MDRLTVAIIQEECLPDDLFCYTNLWIWRVIPRIMLGMGTCGNIASILVTCRKAMRSKPLVVLGMIAAFDLLYMWTSEISTNRWNIFKDGTKEAEVFVRLTSSLLIVAYSASNWAIAIFTIERLANIFFPFTGKLFCTTRKTMIAVVFLTAVHCIFVGPMASAKSLREDNVQSNNTTEDEQESCHIFTDQVRVPCLMLQVILIVSCIILPLMIAITGNIALLTKFLCCKPTIQVNSRVDSQTRMLFGITSFLVISMTATSIGSVIQIRVLDGMEVGNSLILVTIGLHILHLSNYTCNCFVYLCTGKLFQAEFLLMLKDIKNKLTK